MVITSRLNNPVDSSNEAIPDIKDHYQEMYLRWSQYSEKGYYEK